MLPTASILLISLLVCPQLQTQAQNITDVAQATDAAIKDALVQGKAAELAVQTMINEKLPANSLARDAATGILESAQTGLSLCEQSLNTTKQIADYYKCVNAVRGMASASVGELAAKHWASSGAARLGLFW